MSRRRLPDLQPGFAGGLNTVADESQVRADQFRRGVNVRINEYGGARKRYGSQRIHSSAFAAPVRGGFGWIKVASAEELSIANGILSVGTFSVGMTWTAKAGAFSSTTYPSFAQFRDGTEDVVYIADGGPLNKYDSGGTLTVNLAGTPNTAVNVVYNRRLFGITGIDESVYWSDLDNGDTLGIAASGGGQAVIRTFGDQRIRSLAAYGDSLLLFHVTGVSRFTGWSQDDINIEAGTRGVSGEVGTVAPRSVVVTEVGVLFLSDRGIFSADENGVRPVSGDIDVEFTDLTREELEQVTTAHRVKAREVWFFIPRHGIYVFNYRNPAWTGPWTGGYTLSATETTVLWETVDADGIPIVLVGDEAGYVKLADVSENSGIVAQGGSVWASGVWVSGIWVDGVWEGDAGGGGVSASAGLDNVNSNGTGGIPYTMELKLHRMFCGGIAEEKSFRWAYLLADFDSTTGCVFSWATQTDSGNYAIATSSAWGSGTWGQGTWGGEGVVPFRIPIHGRGSFIDVTISDNSSRFPLFSRCEVEAFDMGRRGN